MPYHHADKLENYVTNLFSFSGGGAFAKVALVAMAAAVSYVFPSDPLQDAALAAAILVVTDFFTGLLSAFVTHQARTSKGLSRSIAKLLSYMAVCLVAAVTERTILHGSGISVTMGILWLIVATEGISVIENVEKISGGRFRWLRAILGKVIQQDKADARAAKQDT